MHAPYLEIASREEEITVAFAEKFHSCNHHGQETKATRS